jgi:hypothetical protein
MRVTPILQETNKFPTPHAGIPFPLEGEGYGGGVAPSTLPENYDLTLCPKFFRKNAIVRDHARSAASLL